jgi:hypothetical protein
LTALLRALERRRDGVCEARKFLAAQFVGGTLEAEKGGMPVSGHAIGSRRIGALVNGIHRIIT